MPKRTKKGVTADRFIQETLALIAERGSSRPLNLREISRRLGCAHTNVYNYFASLDDLRWAAYRRALDGYAEAVLDGLETAPSDHALFRRLTGNLVGFAVDHPGLHRFISSDPMDPGAIPEDVLATVTHLKALYMDVIHALCAERLSRDEAATLGNILLAYLDGEMFNLINGRVLPGDDIVGRVLDNAELLFTRLSARTSDGLELRRDAGPPAALEIPTWGAPP